MAEVYRIFLTGLETGQQLVEFLRQKLGSQVSVVAQVEGMKQSDGNSVRNFPGTLPCYVEVELSKDVIAQRITEVVQRWVDFGDTKSDSLASMTVAA